MLGLFALFSLVSCSINREEEDAHEHQEQEHHDPERCGAPLYRSPQGSEHFSEGPLGVHVAAQTCGSGMKPPSMGGFSRGVEGYTSYVGQSTCDPSAKSGVTAFKDLLLATYPCTASYGIVRACNVGGTSEHKEGRAFDWGVSAFTQKHVADSLIQWLLATDAQGNKHAMARRLGIMYMVWNKQIWRSYRSPDAWSAYTGSNPHTDHVHFSFGWDGANKKTSFWTGGATEICSATQNQNCANFGCQCVSGNCAGGFCPGNGCTSQETGDCAKFGCGCVDHKCAGGACAGSGCTAKEEKDCGGFGCNCADHKCSGGFCAGSGCTLKEETECKQKGCGCVDHKCSGGSCNGDGCTAKLQTDCKNQGCTCKDMKCACCTPSTEICDNKDNDCDGKIDEDLSRDCKTACGSGKETCRAGKWEGCTAPKPQTEICDGKDNDCNGQIDEGCQCQSGTSRPCGKNVGTCKEGTQACEGGKWGTCTGIEAVVEICDGKDNDCNGQIDDGPLGGEECDLGGGAGKGRLVCFKGQMLCQAGTEETPPIEKLPEPSNESSSPEDASPPEESACVEGRLCLEPISEEKKLALGESCKDMSDCESNLCLTLEGTSRCSKPCSSALECTGEMECKDGKACWPRDGVLKLDSGEQTCKTDSDCTNGQACDQGFCVPAHELRPVGSGCACSHTSPSMPPLGGLGLLLLLWLRRRKKRGLDASPTLA